LRWVRAVPFLALHVACLAVMLTGVNLVAVGLCLVLFFARMFGVTAGYHRYFSHKSFKTSRLFQFFLAWLGCSAVQKGPLWWVAQHRNHHRYSDTEADPHSPVVKTVWFAHVGWILARDYEKTEWNLVRDWLRFPELRFLNNFHWIPGVILAVLCFLIGYWTGTGAWTALVVGFVVSTVMLYHTTFLVNSVCHLFGKRRYQTTDDSRNNPVVALLTMGEGWHNNHHHYQLSARQGFFWWEIDISYYILKLLSWCRIVWDLRQPPREVLEQTIAKQQV
jgi:stearoyl-CoA desaturase (delta-9 desaturase)